MAPENAPRFETGMTFPSIAAAREALQRHTLARQESFQVYKADRSRLLTRCRDRRCEYSVRIAWRVRYGNATVAYYRPHTCQSEIHENWRTARSVNLLKHHYIETYRADPRLSIAQIETRERENHNPVSYIQAWRILKAVQHDVASEAKGTDPQSEEPSTPEVEGEWIPADKETPGEKNLQYPPLTRKRKHSRQSAKDQGIAGEEKSGS